MMKRIFIISGVLGPKKQGNQSLKNTIIGYLRNGYEVYHFSMISKKSKTHDFNDLETDDNYNYYGFPNIFMSLLSVLNKAKSLKKKDTGYEYKFPEPDEAVDLGITEINKNQIIVAKIYSVMEIIRIIPFILLLKPQILYGYEIYGVKPASFLGKKLGLKVISRFQGTYVTVRNLDWKPIKYHIRMMKSYSTGIVMANDGTKGKEILNRLNIPDKKIFFHVNGIDKRIIDFMPDDGNRERFRLMVNPKGRKYVFGIFNRFYPFKRIDRAIRIVGKLLDEGMDIQLIIGGAGGPLENSLKGLIKELNLQDNIAFIGRIPFDEMPNAYYSCDLVLVTNDYANTGNQIFETIYLGVPLLAVDDDNNSRLYGDCPYSMFVDYTDILNVSKSGVESIIGNRGKKYHSPDLIDWKERMNREIAWVEELAF